MAKIKDQKSKFNKASALSYKLTRLGLIVKVVVYINVIILMMETRKFSNEQVARLLREIAAVYEVKGESLFRIRAYQNAAASIEHATEDLHSLWEEGRLRELPGVGESIASHLDELFSQGQSKHFERVKRGLPPAMFKVLGVPGIGPKTAFRLAKELRLSESKATQELLKAATTGKIASMAGFGKTSQREILESLSKTRKSENRMLLPVAQEIADRLLGYLRKNSSVIWANPLGSLRRQVDTVGDIDIAVATRKPKEVVDYFCRFPEALEVVNKGDVKGRILLKNGRQVDLMVQGPSSYGALLQHFTGSKSHNIHLRELAKSRGLSLSEKGIKDLKGKVQIFKDEESFYRKLGLSYIPPELREDRGEIDASLQGNLPALIEVGDIRGDLQAHTVWSDGENSFKEMAQAAIERGYEYLGLTDHQLGMERLGKEAVLKEIRKRKRIIEHFNGSNNKIRVLNGIEILIKSGGSLAYPGELLSEFDYVIAAIHTGFGLSRQENTQRVIEALANPFVKIIAHPTGRMIGRREEMEIDWEKVFKACAQYKKILEIDSMPDRLDLPDLLVRQAKEYGVKFVIDSDAHATEHFEYVKYGVSIARRGWLTKNEVVNTLPFDKMVKELRMKVR